MSLNATGEGLLPPPGEAVGAPHEAEGVPAVAGIVSLTLGAVLLFVVLVVLVYSFWPRRSRPPPPPAPESPKKAPAEAGPPPRIPIIVMQPNDDCVLGDLEPSAHPTWKDDLEAGPQDDPYASASEPAAGGAVQGGHLLPGVASGIQGAWGYAPGQAPARKCVVVVSSP